MERLHHLMRVLINKCQKQRSAVPEGCSASDGDGSLGQNARLASAGRVLQKGFHV